jgi:tetratricopeptide (TPR) repeat protein
MAKIYFFIFSILFLSIPSYPSEKGRITKDLRKKTYELFKLGEYSKALPYIERYLEIQPAEIYMRLVYAQALLFKEDLPIPSREEDNYTRSEKWKTIKQNYGHSATLFEENIRHFEMVRPRDPSLGKWYFHWATAEWFSGNKEKAIVLFKKSVKKDFTLTDAYYNVGAIYDSMGQTVDAENSWRQYYQAEKELNVDD